MFGIFWFWVGWLVFVCGLFLFLVFFFDVQRNVALDQHLF